MPTETRTTSSTGGQKGAKLARFDLIPQGPLTRLAEHYGRGAAKYADHQWRKGYEWSKSFAAKQRHDAAFWAGEDYDVCPADGEGCAFVTAEGEPFEAVKTEHGRTCYNHTGSHHMAASAWHAFALLEFAEEFPEFDDRFSHGYRPERMTYREWQKRNGTVTLLPRCSRRPATRLREAVMSGEIQPEEPLHGQVQSDTDGFDEPPTPFLDCVISPVLTNPDEVGEAFDRALDSALPRVAEEDCFVVDSEGSTKTSVAYYMQTLQQIARAFAEVTATPSSLEDPLETFRSTARKPPSRWDVG